MEEGDTGRGLPAVVVLSPRGTETAGCFRFAALVKAPDGEIVSLALDQDFMRRALRLAERGRGATRPNPIVGAVVVSGGRVVGEGWHRAAGLPHAEALALARAGARAGGGTLYVTLEPCAHHGRTPPCVDAIVAAGIRRCVVAMRDPHRIVNGRGLRRLRSSGVRVVTGVLGNEARQMLAGYVRAHERGLPRVTWKVATTLDGKVADGRGRSRWITGPAARAEVHRMRAAADAIVIGSGTARADDPRLTVRGTRRRAPQPLRVVCDSRLRLPLTLRLFRRPLARGTVVACRNDAPARKAMELERRGVAVWRLPATRGGVSPRAVARRLASAGCHDVLLEAGPRLGTAWMRAGLVDRVAWFVAPKLLGEPGIPWCGPLGRVSLSRALPGRIQRLKRCGADASITLELEA